MFFECWCNVLLAQQSVLLDIIWQTCSNRHKYQRVCLEFFDSKIPEYSSSAALAGPLQYPYAKWEICMFCMCEHYVHTAISPRELHNTNTTLSDTNTAAQPCARHTFELNCESFTGRCSGGTKEWPVPEVGVCVKVDHWN